MKYSICTSGMKQEQLWDIIPKVADIGYDGVEIAEMHLQKYMEDEQEFKKLFDRLAQYKLVVPVISSGFVFAASETAYEQSIEKLKKLIDISLKLGKPQIRVFMDWIADENDAREKWDIIVKGLKEMAAIARSKGINLVLETHQQQLMDRLGSTLRLLEDVDTSVNTNIKINLDIHNLFFLGDDPIECLVKLYPYVTHVHLKNGERVPGDDLYGKYGIYLDEGDMDYKPFLSKIKELDYSGFLSIEYFGEKIWEAAAHELNFLKSYFNEK